MRRQMTGDEILDSSIEFSNPIFILCFPRSGSTLLRYCLDSHPEISCPPETNLASVFASLQEFVLTFPASSKEEGYAAVDALCREVADRTLGGFMRLEGKERWCDKSLTSISYIELIRRVYPRAQYICLFRECTESVMSGIDASPWGYGGYGFAPYVRTHVDNVVLGLVQHWIDMTTALCAVVDSNEGDVIAIRYEDLVAKPEETLRGIYDFLGCKWDKKLASEEVIFGSPHAIVERSL